MATLSAAEVTTKVLQATRPVVLDFYQAGCPPCRVLEPRLARLAQRYIGQGTVYRVDVDRDPALVERFGVTSLPTVLVVHDGREVERLDGLISDAHLTAAIEQARRL